MKRHVFGIMVMVLALTGIADAGKPSSCTNVPITVSFVTAPASAINNDIGQVVTLRGLVTFRKTRRLSITPG